MTLKRRILTSLAIIAVALVGLLDLSSTTTLAAKPITPDKSASETP